MTILDKVLIHTFYLFGFVALIFEPLYYFGCDWELAKCQQSSSKIVQIVGQIWSIYCQWDPLFINLPLWLRVLCSIEVFIFGPCYILAAYGYQYKCTWHSYLISPFCGALIYSTIVYFAMEWIEFVPGTNMYMVFIVNIPWTIFPIILIYKTIMYDSMRNQQSSRKIK
jgi:hypothetical protein